MNRRVLLADGHRNDHGQAKPNTDVRSGGRSAVRCCAERSWILPDLRRRAGAVIPGRAEGASPESI